MPVIEHPNDWSDYQVIDSGDGEKLESIGGYRIIRPDPRIIWKKHNSPEWNKFDATYVRTSPTEGKWNIIHPPPSNWKIQYKNLIFALKPTEFKHIGVFPEQSVNWNWLINTISNNPISVLNLFAYTGGATLASLTAGARVVHLDASKGTVEWAKENARFSGLSDKPVRWITDDAMKFIEREARRGNTYDGIILDPPKFGRGPKGEVWKLEKDLPKLFEGIKKILSAKPQFLLLNAYTADLSPIALYNLVSDVMKPFGGTPEYGELTLKESLSGRLIPHGLFVRWKKE